MGVACPSRYYYVRLKTREREVCDLRENLLAQIHMVASASNDTLIELVRGVCLAQARVFVISFVLIGLQTLAFSGIMSIVRRRA